MKNFSITKNGKEYWVARNVAVSCFVFTSIDGVWHVLANKRGDGTPDYQGYWNAPCGYLDYDETTSEAAMREVYEETGVKLNKVTFFGFSDSPCNNHQNITFRYYSIISDPQLVNISVNNRGGEIDEVKDIKWIPITKIFNYGWAFNHDEIIIDIIKQIGLN
jgi:8-oxo-dGTP pyrophosphatase MutT (NUDIX family)